MKVREVRTFSNYRVGAMKLFKLWTDFHRDMTKELQAEINKEIVANRNTYNSFQMESERLRKLDGEEKTKAIEAFTDTYTIPLAKLFDLSKQLEDEKDYCLETFLTIDNGKFAKMLTDLWFEDCDVDHAKDRTEAEHEEYMTWMFGVASDFFTSFKDSTTLKRKVSSFTENSTTPNPQV